MTPWTAAYQASDTSVSYSLLQIMSIDSVMSSNNLIFCYHLFPMPSIFPRIRVFSNELALPIRWPKYWCFSFNISPSNEYSGLISFDIKSLLQNHSLKASVLQCSVFFIFQLSHMYMTTGKAIVLIMWTFVGKVMSLLFNTL